MTIKLYREVNQIQGGWASRCGTLNIAAHGYSPEVADKNLERLVRQFFAPFQREGILEQETQALGLGSVEDVSHLEIIFEWPGARGGE